MVMNIFDGICERGAHIIIMMDDGGNQRDLCRTVKATSSSRRQADC
jgi:hypothetical protein